MLRQLRELNSQSGQALIVAVLVMLIVAVLAALFLAIVAAQLRQAEREAYAVTLQQVAEAGLRFADYNLVHGPEGADWRPDPNPGTFPYGEGEFRLTVHYQPQPGDPYSRFIKIESVARIRGNPFLQRRAVGYKPILITDYIRFVHNLEKNPLPASLGANFRMYLYEDPPEPAPGRLYKAVFDGPIRVNSDLRWHGDVQVNLWSAWGDNVVVAGDISHDEVRRYDPVAGDWGGPLSEVLVARDGGWPEAVAATESAAFTTLGGVYRDGRLQDDDQGYPRWVRYLEPPRLDPQRYLTLTRDSGVWIDGAPGTEYEGRQVNTGWFGFGKGIYIDNPEHIKHEHDYEQMRSEWVVAAGSDDAVEIVIDPGVPGVTAPQLNLTWRNPGPGAGFRSPRGEPGLTDLNLPFPENGVVYAAGDVAVSGVLPPRVGSPGRYYDQPSYRFDPNTGARLSPAADTNRHYHLTIVSGGNIFIEGNLLSPVAAQLPGADAATDTKLALLARDSVVLNTTKFEEVLQPATQINVEGTRYWEVRPDRPLDVRVTTASMDPIQIYLTHTGQPNLALPAGRAGAAIMQVLINGVPYNWDLGVPVYSDGSEDYWSKYWLFLPPPVYGLHTFYNNETNAIYPIEESLPNIAFGADKRITFRPTGIGHPHIIRLQVTRDSPRFYWVRNIRARVDVEINALIYAEHGSWYIIPGAWENPPEPEGDPNADPKPGEPLDVRITIRGAVAENRTAPLADVIDWSAKWRGSNASWLPTSGNYDLDLEISAFTLRYLYDYALRQALLPQPGSPPRLPKLPVSPAMIAWGERI